MASDSSTLVIEQYNVKALPNKRLHPMPFCCVSLTLWRSGSAAAHGAAVSRNVLYDLAHHDRVGYGIVQVVGVQEAGYARGRISDLRERWGSLSFRLSTATNPLALFA